jgi:DNA-binding NarL/FixJ family response regulator
MTLKIVVADDHTVVQEGLRVLLSAVDGYELVGVASSGPEAVRAAVTLRPNVVVMDIQMPGMTGIQATREIARVAPDVAVLMLTMFEDDESVFAAMRAGALGRPRRVTPTSRGSAGARATARSSDHGGHQRAI